ncbi:hypothetical protein [Streptomyces sp. NBC_01800]|uniref:hypothetical protein n=1 Tax=Streptomyces sp. NBC_01800 TaxID=2975945 RepID=UPI002DD7E6DD|nr:hypothetical protein [Streptomyces sp. NBC_01800]WSA66173.1 hypothetical protein OIE65_03675 [Streptomyces sp. NBC_01800]
MADASAQGRTGLAVPCAWGVAVSPGLPHTARGKIKKFALREWLHDREGVPRRRAGMTVLAAYSR